MQKSTAVQKPIANKKAKIALIHVAKKAVSLTDEEYCSLLIGAAGIDSAKDLEYEYQFDEIMNVFKRLGFVSRKTESKSASRFQWTDKWGCTPAQRAKIETMWQTCARVKTDQALRVFIKRITHVDHPVFLRPALANKVISALGSMMIKAGYDPKTGRRFAP
jgi:phage gp16-like protein